MALIQKDPFSPTNDVTPRTYCIAGKHSKRHFSFTESLWLASKVPLDFSKAGLFFKGNLFLRASSPLSMNKMYPSSSTCAMELVLPTHTTRTKS